MRNEIKVGLVFLLSVMLSACANGALKAPCDDRAHFCGSKTKINHW